MLTYNTTTGKVVNLWLDNENRIEDGIYDLISANNLWGDGGVSRESVQVTLKDVCAACRDPYDEAWAHEMINVDYSASTETIQKIRQLIADEHKRVLDEHRSKGRYGIYVSAEGREIMTGYANTLLGAKRKGRKGVFECCPNGEGGYRVYDYETCEYAEGESRGLHTGYEWC